jgi:ATP-dependent DNA helicase DinG
MKPNQKKIDPKKISRDRQMKLKEILLDQVDSKYELRKIQEFAFEQSKEVLLSGKKFLALELPTGAGKSILSQFFIKWYIKNINVNAKFDILTSSKILQEQYTHEFKYINNLWGRANYRCDRHDHNCDYGKTCNNNTKQAPCEDCPFRESLVNWSEGRVSLSNFHIHGLYALFNPKLHENRQSDVLIVDEAHMLEETINGFVSFSLNSKTWKNLMTNGRANRYEETMSTFKSISDFADWLRTSFLIDLGISEADHRKQLFRLQGKKMEQKLKVLKEVEELKGKMERFLKDYHANTSEWVFDKQVVKGEATWIIQPLWTSEIMRNSIWQNYKHVIVMSGTLISSAIFNRVNGIEDDRSHYISMPSPFPVANRPIYYYNNGKMSFRNKAETWQRYIPVIEKILKKYQGKKGIIHCGNYELMEWMKRDINNPRLVYAEQGKREEALEEHISREDDCVIVSPSMIQGVDLIDDLSRFQVILKVPYPALASKVNKQRLETNPEWYAWRTVSDLVQAYGRSIRSETDHADTFILDGCFSDVMMQSSHLLPQYFKNAIKRIK